MITRLYPPLLQHAEKVLGRVLRLEQPADRLVSAYFRENQNIGHAERGFIAETVFAILRQKRVLEWRCKKDLGQAATPKQLLFAALFLEKKWRPDDIRALFQTEEKSRLDRLEAALEIPLPEDISPAIRHNLPDWLYEKLAAQYHEPTLGALCQSLLNSAPLDLRVNRLKASRDAVLETLKTLKTPAKPTPFSPLGIRLLGKPALQKMPLFLEGTIEVQDEGSQLVALLLGAKRGEMVADFCAGAGGKTLLLGAEMRNTGRLYAFDVAEKRLQKLKPRLARSGLSNVEPVRIANERDVRIKRLAGKMARVLVDAPCSGLGTLRRNPDLKWRQTPETILELQQKQTAILDAAASLLRPGGRLVYATCSLLALENQNIVARFLDDNPHFSICPVSEILETEGIVLENTGDFLSLFPHQHDCDGFFAAVLERK